MKQNKSNNKKELVIPNSKSRQHETSFKSYFRNLLSLIEIRPIEQKETSNTKICHEITVDSLKYVMSFFLINSPSKCRYYKNSTVLKHEVRGPLSK